MHLDARMQTEYPKEEELEVKGIYPVLPPISTNPCHLSGALEYIRVEAGYIISGFKFTINCY